jgi:Winged helix DNA-binding domain
MDVIKMMKSSDIIRYRLYNQQISGTKFRRPEEIVEGLGAVQAQDYSGGLWGVGLRLPVSTLVDIEKALIDRKIIRTWPLRGTLHFVPAQDARWMLELLTQRVIRRSAGRYKELSLNDEIFERSEELISQALVGGRQLTREAMYDVLAKGGINPEGQRSYHILGYLAQRGVICLGAREGKHQTFVLFDEWVAESRRLERDEALAEIARRYFTSHGPATLQDFVWWTGLAAADAKAGLEMVKQELTQEVIDGKHYWLKPSSNPAREDGSPIACLLPNYDEYMIGYKDRSAMFQVLPEKSDFQAYGRIALNHTIIIDGVIVGSWRRERKNDRVVIRAKLFRPLDNDEKDALSMAVDRYGAFFGDAGFAILN